MEKKGNIYGTWVKMEGHVEKYRVHAGGYGVKMGGVGEKGKVKREVDSVKSAKNLKNGERIGGK